MSKATALESERAVLGACLQVPDTALPAVLQVVNAGDFAVKQHGQALDLMRKLWNAGESLDAVTFTQKALDAGVLEPDTMMLPGDWITSCANPHHARQYAREVRAKAQRRRAVEYCDALMQKITAGDASEEVDFRGLLEDHMVKIGTLQQATLHSHKGLRDGHEVVSGVAKTMAARYRGRGHPLGLTIGFTDLDRMINGFQRSDFVVLGARPAMGKTALGTAFAEGVALDAANRRNRPVLMFTLEMGDEQIMERSILGRARIKLGKGRTGMFSEAEGSVWLIAERVLREMKGRPAADVASAIVGEAAEALESYWKKKGKFSEDGESRITKAEFDEAIDEMKRLAEGIAAVASGTLTFYDGYGVTTQEIRTQIREWVRRIGWSPDDPDPCPPLVIIDYLQLVKASEKANAREPRLTIMEVCSVVKGLAKELNICIIGLAQVGRGAADNPGQKPQLKDLKESGAFEEYADYVLFLHRECYYKPYEKLDKEQQKRCEDAAAARQRAGLVPRYDGLRWDGQSYYEGRAIVTVAKGRHCGTGDVEVIFHGPFVRFASATPALYSNNKEKRQQAVIPLADDF